MRYALVIGNSEYEDHTLATLKTPMTDVQELAKALGDPLLGEFDSVTSIVNQPEPVARRGISQFLAQKKPDDLVLLYFSCHGLLDDRGRLFLAAKDTQTELLKATGISASFITDEMDSCRSRRQVLILDCCYGGAFARGSKGGSDKALTETTFEGSGYGRVVLTASDSTQFALEGDQVVDQAELSLFTHYLLHGLTSGDADLNHDGQVTLDELYDYTYLNVVSQTPRQTPCKWSYNQQGDLRIARNPNPVVVKPVELPPELREALENPYSSVRVGAVEALRRMLASSDPGAALAAKLALERLQTDDSRSVSEAAGRLLAEINPPAAAEPMPKANAVITPIAASPSAVASDSIPQANAVITPIPESAPLPGTKRQRKPAAPSEPTHLVTENIQLVNKAAAAQTAFKPEIFWAGWIGALLAGGGLFALELLAFKTIQADYAVLTILSMGLVGALTGVLQWWMLRPRLSWAAAWLVGNIGLSLAIGWVVFTAYYIWDGLLIISLLIAWVGFNLIAGGMRAAREFSSMPPEGDQALDDLRPGKSLDLGDWRIWAQWLGYPLAVVLAYLIGYEVYIKHNSDFYSFVYPLLMISGGVAGLLQWSVLRQYRGDTAAWMPANVLALGLVAMFTSSGRITQAVLLFSWLAINMAVSAVLVLSSGEKVLNASPQVKVGRRPSALFFGLVWVCALPIGFGVAFTIKMSIESSGVDYTAVENFAILAGIGSIVGLGQWLVLRKILAGSGWWMIVNGLWLGWVGYELTLDQSETSFGNTVLIAYLLANLIFGITLYVWKTRQPKAEGKPAI